MATAIKTPVQNLIPTGSWSVDPIHSSVGFEVKHMVVSTFRGNFREFDALLEASEGTSRLVGHRTRPRASTCETRTSRRIWPARSSSTPSDTPRSGSSRPPSARTRTAGSSLKAS